MNYVRPSSCCRDLVKDTSAATPVGMESFRHNVDMTNTLSAPRHLTLTTILVVVDNTQSTKFMCIFIIENRTEMYKSARKTKSARICYLN